MHTNLKPYKMIAIATIGSLLLLGCSSRRGEFRKCRGGEQLSGYFCYQGLNFGRNKSNNYKAGVVDGCVTANGTFQKNYKLSSGSKEYNDGWIVGRSQCKQDLKNVAQPRLSPHNQTTAPAPTQSRPRLKRI